MLSQSPSLVAEPGPRSSAEPEPKPDVEPEPTKAEARTRQPKKGPAKRKKD